MAVPGDGLAGGEPVAVEGALGQRDSPWQHWDEGLPVQDTALEA